MGVDILELRGQYEYILGRVDHMCYLCMLYYEVVLSLLGAFFGAYPAMIRLLGENLRIASGDGEVDLRDLEDLGVVQFTIIVAVTERLELSLLSDFGSP